MKKQTFTLLAVALVASLQLKADEQQIPLTAAEAVRLIDQNSWRDRIASFETRLTSKGFQREEIFGAEIKGDAENSSSISGKLIIIPFTNPNGEHAVIIASTSEGAGAVEDTVFYTTGKMEPCGGCFESAAAGAGKSITAKAAISWSDVEQLFQFIRAADFRSVFSWITSKLRLNPDWILAPMVRSAYERAGYYCPSPPPFFPFKSLWYFSTCARKVY